MLNALLSLLVLVAVATVTRQKFRSSEFGRDGPSFHLNRPKNSYSSGAGYTASNSSAVVFKFGVRLDK